MSTRDDHLMWCKMRAKEYLDMGDVRQAWGSFCSDMMKHDETRAHPALQLGVMLQFSGNLSTVPQVRKFIEDFN